MKKKRIPKLAFLFNFKYLLLTLIVSVAAISQPVCAVDFPDTTLGSDSAYTINKSDTKSSVVNYSIIEEKQAFEYTDVYGRVHNIEYSVKNATPEYYTINYKIDETNNRTTTPNIDINEHFVKNNADASGGAVSNGYGFVINSITGDFLGNYTTNTIKNKTIRHGGALYNNGTISSISGDFVENHIDNNTSFSQGNSFMGAAIYNDRDIGTIKSNFIGNYFDIGGSGLYNGVRGAGVYNNRGTINYINGHFINNHSYTSLDASVYATLVNYDGKITGINGDFVGNESKVPGGSVYGGALYNSGTIDFLNSNFISNEISTTLRGKNARGGAIMNVNVSSGGSDAYIGSLTGDFINNKAIGTTQVYGGAIWNNAENNYRSSTINEINSSFYNNYVQSTSSDNKTVGGAIGNYSNKYNAITEIVSLKGDFINNQAISLDSGDIFGGAVANWQESGTAKIGKIKGNFIGNNIQGTGNGMHYGGAIYNTGTIESIDGSFINNYVYSKSSNIKGGAVYTTKDMKFLADGHTNIFSGNYIQKIGSEKENSAIYVDSSNAKITFEPVHNGVIFMNDRIDGVKGYDITVNSDGTGTFYMLNDLNNADVSFNNATINTVNNNVNTYQFNSFLVENNANMIVDVDLQNKSMDRIVANSYNTMDESSKLNVLGFNLLNEAASDKTAIYFAQPGLKDYVTTTGTVPDSNFQTTVFSPIYKYTVTYDKDTVYDETLGDGGYFVFTRGAIAASSNASSKFNPSVLVSSANAQAGAYLSQLQTYNYAFQHSDLFMNHPSSYRFAEKSKNKIAITDANGVFSPLITKEDYSGFWMKPYSTFENVPLKNGPKVQNIGYGTLIGFDDKIVPLKHGWDRVMTYYLGYNGSNQHFSGTSTVQNGGLLGTTMTLYKGNFFNATTLSAGASVGDSHTMYGSEVFTSLLAGIGNKTGYNVEVKDGKFIIQPSMLMSYTFINTFDYTNAAGVKINSDPMSMIQISPNIKFIGNTKKGWQPYFTTGMVWNLMAHSDVKANSVELPNMYIKPYVQYGVGIQRVIKDRFTAFAQSMIYNGGRNGLLLTFGLRFTVGKKNSNL